MKCPEHPDHDLTGGSSRGEWRTLVGYYSPPGHNHDDNCRCRVYRCGGALPGADDHSVTVSIINRCPAEGCDWRGRTDCFCSLKVEEWP